MLQFATPKLISVHSPVETHVVFTRCYRTVFAWSANSETLTPKLFSFFAFVNLHSCERAHTTTDPYAPLDARIKLIYSVYRRSSLDFSRNVTRARRQSIGWSTEGEEKKKTITRNLREGGEQKPRQVAIEDGGGGDSHGLCVKLRVFASIACAKSRIKYTRL